MTQQSIRPARLAGFLTVLVGGLILVGSLRTEPLPGLGAPAADWFREVAPAEGLLAVLRLAVLVGLAYLLGATLLTVASAMIRSDPVDRWAERCTGPTLHRFLRAAAGVGIGTVTSWQSIAAGAAPPPVTAPSEPVPAATAEPTAEEITTLTRIDDPDAPAPEEESVRSPSAPADAPDPAVTAPTDGAGADTTAWWTVEPGDHLWRIAEETLLDLRGEAPSTDEVAAYWHVVCEANHDRLVDPDNPDLIMPGQRIVLPPVSAG